MSFFPQFLLDFPQHNKASPFLYLLLSWRRLRVTSLSLPASAQHQRRTLLHLLLIMCVWRVLWAFSVPVLLAGFIHSRFLVDRSLLIPV